MSIEGKLANQYPKTRCICEKCCKKIDLPELKLVQIGNHPNATTFYIHSYLTTPYYIYETSNGRAVVYCSQYCRDKHNHRFNKKGK
jgi:hypothetical protein